MTGNQELETAYRLWKLLCEMQNFLFGHYAEDFMDIYADEQIEMMTWIGLFDHKFPLYPIVSIKMPE